MLTSTVTRKKTKTPVVVEGERPIPPPSPSSCLSFPMLSCCCPFPSFKLRRGASAPSDSKQSPPHADAVQHVSFGPNGGWFVKDKRGVYFANLSADLTEVLEKKPTESGEEISTVEFVAISARGGFFVRRVDGSIEWSRVPSDLVVELSTASESTPAWVAFGPGDSWCCGYKNGSTSFSSLPRSLSVKILAAEEYGWLISYVSIGYDGSYFVEYSDKRQVWKALPPHLAHLLEISGGSNYLALSASDASYFVSIGDENYWEFDGEGFSSLLCGGEEEGPPQRSRDVGGRSEKSRSVKGKERVRWEDLETTPLMENAQRQSEEYFIDAYEAEEDQGKNIVYLDPKSIAYTAEELLRKFQDGRSLLNTINQLNEGKISPSDLAPIEVFFVDGAYRTENNHRLYCFRHAHDVASIPCNIVSTPPWWEDRVRQEAEESDEGDSD